MSLPKSYDPKKTESKWYTFWEEKELFKANAHSGKPPYCIVIPPPNVTGVLHMGHALVNVLQDVLIRWKRMSGYEALWIPGTDHAGIATQTVVERHLLKTQGKRRKDFSREEFLSIVWKWKEEKEQNIIDQLKKLGCSLDWSRLHFTMDEMCNRAVRTIFKMLFDQGLIYRGNYLVNWDPLTQTALADDEVEHEEREAHLYYFRYPLVDGSGYAVIATTRPETMLGDTAIAVSPKDTRYLSLIGKSVRHPLTERVIPIIADHYVSPEFGSGMVKITPAHDFNDYQIGTRHNLPFINVLTPDGKINEQGGVYAGMTREEARDLIIEWMREQGLVEKIDTYTLRVGVSYRSKAVLEPYLSKQWFVKMDSFRLLLRDAVKEKRVKILPNTWEHTYFHWIDNLRDWCISRQLWWGHRIPVWYHVNDHQQMICYDGPGLPPEVEKQPNQWVQDEDVLDTWFSSALWPFSTLGWPDRSDDFKTFYPNAVLVTGHDILFFWVARMIGMGLFATGQVPFPETFLHGLIYGKSYWRTTELGETLYISGNERKEFDRGKPVPPDVSSKWEKLSKSKGNVIDPLDLIADYGTDAMRMTLCSIANQTPQIDLDYRRFEEFKNFANKIWNGARFVLLNTEDLTAEEFASGIVKAELKLEDRWILSRLNDINRKVGEALESYSFDKAALAAYEFFWKEFCAYYVETAKPVLFGKADTPQDRKTKQKLLIAILCNAVRLLHPMAPFITEELFQLLKERFSAPFSEKTIDPYTRTTLEALSSVACMVAPFPKVIDESDIQPEIEKTFAFIDALLYTIRNIRGEMKIPSYLATDVFIVGKKDDPSFALAEENRKILLGLIKIDNLAFTEQAPLLTFSSRGSVSTLQVVIPLPEELKEQEKERLIKEKLRLAQDRGRLKEQLSNPQFLKKANPELIERQKALLFQTEKVLETIETQLTQE